MEVLNIAIAMPANIFREGLQAVLSDQPEMVVTSTVEHTDDLHDLSLEDSQIIILDLDIPELEYREIVSEILTSYPHLNILAIGDSKHQGFLRQIIESGISGYIFKKQDGDDFIEALQKIHAGGKYITNDILLDLLQRNDNYRSSGELTDREREVLVLICEEMTSNQIADKLSISERTVATHRNNILQKTMAKNTAGMVKYAIKNQIYTL